ncbi:MAG: hypothetical protein D4R68_01125 [Ignavibacteriales bacterium]|nr:MAG: hypothetical protein D4R68_01125 [Ignavibacteriales bacterium]
MNYPELNNKTLVLPDKISTQLAFHQGPESIKVNIFVSFDGTCSSCYRDINKLISFINKDRKKEHIRLFLIASKAASLNRDLITNNDSINLILYPDISSEFIYTNKLENFPYGWFICDSNNKINIIGNPYGNRLLWKYYRRIFRYPKNQMK